MSQPPFYQESFERARPNATFSAVQQRVALLRAITTDLASYYHERAQAEEAYTKALHKLSSKLKDATSSAGGLTVASAIADLGVTDRKEQQQQLGAWHAVLQVLERDLDKTTSAHDSWRKRALDDVETFLRSSLNNPDWSRWSQAEAQLSSTVKEYDVQLDKVQKNQGKATTSGKASSKLLTAQSQLSTLVSSLTSALPPFLAQSQALEQTHVTFLKERLVLVGTASSDLGREHMELGEHLLNSVLGVDEQVEMQTWALREGVRAGANNAAGENGDGSRLQHAYADSEFAPSTNEFGTRSIRDDTIYETTAQSRADDASSAAPRSPVPTSRAMQPPPAAPLPLPTPSSTPSKASRGFKSLFKRDKSSGAPSSKYGNLEVPSRADAARRDQRPSIDSRDSSVAGPEEAYGTSRPAVERGVSNTSSLMGGGSNAAAAMQAPIQPSRPRGASGSSTTGRKRDSLMPFGGSNSGGGLFRRASKQSTSSSPAFEQRESDGGLASNENNSAQAGSVATGPVIDAEGYSVPPEGYDRQPWSVQHVGGSSNLMDDDEDDSGLSSSGAQPLKLTSMAITPSTIRETEDERRAALENVKSTLLSSAAAPPANLSRRATRSRRDVRSTTYNPSIPDDVPLAQVIEQQRSRESSTDGLVASGGTKQSLASPIGSGNTFNGDRANSMRSNLSNGRATHGVDPFEEASSPGVRAAISETVNVLSKGGEAGRVMVTGEIALSHRVASTLDSSSTGLRIRIAQFEQFEKVAPNPAYLSPVAGSPGEYMLLPALGRASRTVTVLKYQLHIDPGSESSVVPLTVKALWKCDQGQTRVIVNYATNTSSRLLAQLEASPFDEDEDRNIQMATLEKLTFAIPTSVPVTTFQAKPAAELSADKQRLTFHVDSIALRGADGGKLLASLATEGKAVAQPIAVSWHVADSTVSNIDIELVGSGEDNGTSVVETVRSTAAGKFLVAP
ncbi:hypothetical protein OIO90_004412 [Microbotryomycetes sp. JL221]|nr:hypothetical protein OIO90_004412 [Microbotryomycetes sp. JL221]